MMGFERMAPSLVSYLGMHDHGYLDNISKVVVEAAKVVQLFVSRKFCLMQEHFSSGIGYAQALSS